jgi:cobalt-zinc-cadmium efflux system membrane fusion protein
VKAERRPMRNQLRAMGKVLAPQTKKAIVSYAFPARISDIHANIGDWVETGQKLVTLQSEEVGKARADFFKAQADFELAKRNLEREKNLFDRGVGAQKNVLTTEAEFKVAEAGLNAAEKKLHVLGFTEDQVEELNKSHQVNPIISLYAPIGGKVIASNAVLGAMVDQATEILIIMDPTVLWVEAEIYERDIAKIRIGQDVQVSVPAYPEEVFPGKISFIGDILNEGSRTITVRTEIRNREFKLKPGMFSDMTVFLNHPDAVLALPEAAVLDDRDRKIVFISAAEGYRLQAVSLGIKEGGYWQILEGLTEGDEVVTAGNYQLKSKLYEEILHSSHVH